MNETSPALDDARRLADEVLFPGALETDAAPLVPRARLDALAGAGLYGVAGPAGLGGVPAAERDAIAEALAGGCLTTALVWIQHHSGVRAVRDTANAALRDAWLEPLCRGERRSGVAFAYLRRPGPPAVTARPLGDGAWAIDGEAPWVTGWGRIDAVYTAAREPGGDIVWVLIDAAEGETLETEPVRLAAVSASGTVRMRLRNHRAEAGRVLAVEAYDAWQRRDAAALRRNGALALGVASRCAMLLDDAAISAAIAECRSALRTAADGAVAPARARASQLALHAATALVVRGGGRSMLLDQHAQRLAREALFLQVFGQNSAMRDAQNALLSSAL